MNFPRFRCALTPFVVAGLLWAPLAHSQKAPSPAPAKKAGKSGAAASPSKPADDAKVDDPLKAEASARFDRGLKLFNAGDNAGALAEFKRIHEILPNPVVLYNIGLVYAAMARPVDAVDALEPAIRSGALSAGDLERAKQTFAEQSARIARLVVTTSPDGARIEIDSVQVAKTPLAGPIRVAEGSHIVGAVAEGYAPARKEIVVAGNVDANVHLELVPTQSKQMSNLAVRSLTKGADVLVDGKPAGRTPLTASITLPAGRHVVELKRAGYVSGRREIDLGAGATGDLALDLAVDRASLDTEGATLVVESSESPFDVGVDGQRRTPYAGPLRLPRGPHHVSVTAAGFIPTERDVNLDPSVTNVVKFGLEPTPETRENHRSAAMMHRTWGWVGIVSGAVIAGTGVTLAVLGSSQKKDGEAGLAEHERKLDADEPPCDAKNGYKGGGGSPFQCDTLESDAQADVDAGRNKSIAGYVGIGVGSALAVTGVVLLLTGDDPDKYEHPKARSSGPRWAVVPGPGDVGTALRATF